MPGLRSDLALPLQAYRIGRHSHGRPIYDTDGAAGTPGRWNRCGEGVIYASECCSTAVLETLVHLPTPRLPGNRHVATFTIPSGTSFDVFDPDDHAGWDARDDPTVAREYGSLWYQERRSAVLLVPSVIAPSDRNVVINPNHPDARGFVKPLVVIPFQWDERLQRLLQANGDRISVTMP